MTLIPTPLCSNQHRRLDRLADSPLAAVAVANHLPIQRITLDGDAPRFADQTVELRE